MFLVGEVRHPPFPLGGRNPWGSANRRVLVGAQNSVPMLDSRASCLNPHPLLGAPRESLLARNMEDLTPPSPRGRGRKYGVKISLRAPTRSSQREVESLALTFASQNTQKAGRSKILSVIAKAELDNCGKHLPPSARQDRNVRRAQCRLTTARAGAQDVQRPRTKCARRARSWTRSVNAIGQAVPRLTSRAQREGRRRKAAGRPCSSPSLGKGYTSPSVSSSPPTFFLNR
jgi:hypothetical protein